jgi:hypothetical protein
MASDDSGIDPDGAGEDRRELERIAFGRPETADDAAAAEAALRRLVAADRAASDSPGIDVVAVEDEYDPGPGIPSTPVAAGGAAPAVADGVAEEDEPPAGRRRGVLPLLIAVGLLAGLGAGVVLGRSAPSVTPTPAPSARLFLGFAPSAASLSPGSASSSEALAETEKPQTAQDVLPGPGFPRALGIEPASVHRILTTDDGYTLWVARTSEDICMLFTTAEKSEEIGFLGEGSACATPEEFAQRGLTLRADRDEWVWDGANFDTTIVN